MSNDFNNIASQASKMASNNSKTDWDKVALNLFLIPTTLGAIQVDTEDTKHLENTSMPDSWCDSVSELPNVSTHGLEVLTKDLSKKGFVSIAAANRFVEIEKQVAVDRKQKQKVTNSLKNEGASKLLARAEREIPGSIQTFIDTSKDIGFAMTGAAELAVEKTVWVGKGLGAAASFLKDVRKG